jgi:sorting nexin-29
MLNDLMTSGILKKLTQLVGVTMAGSRATVRVDNQYTPTFSITNGVRQGDALSSVLFDLVLEALTRKLNTTGQIGTKSTQILAYADDMAVLSRNKNALKDVLDNTESEARERGLIVNENKTKYMEVTRTVVNGNDLQCGKYEFKHVKELSYLGSQLNQTNSTNCEIQARIISGNQCYYSCGALMKSRALNRSSKSKICTTLIRPVVTYGCEA